MQKRFWLNDDFIDEQARKISAYAQGVFMCMCRHANRQGITFIGARKMAQKLHYHKDTVFKARKELQVVGLVAPLKDNRWSVSAVGGGYRTDLSGRSGSPKGINPIKEDEILTKEQKTINKKVLKKLRASLAKRGIIKSKK